MQIRSEGRFKKRNNHSNYVAKANLVKYPSRPAPVQAGSSGQEQYSPFRCRQYDPNFAVSKPEFGKARFTFGR